MQTEQFIARNIKCNGCVATIRKNLLTLPGVETVTVTLASGGVSININSLPGAITNGSTIEVQGMELSRERITTCLLELGYPVIG